VATLYDIKPAFQALLRPLTGRLAATSVTANQVTFAAALLSVATGVVLALWPERRLPFLLLPAVLFVRMALNAIDGMLAREFGQASTLGMYLNELCDVISDIALILPFALVAPFAPTGVVAFAIAAAIVEFAGVLGNRGRRRPELRGSARQKRPGAGAGHHRRHHRHRRRPAGLAVLDISGTGAVVRRHRGEPHPGRSQIPRMNAGGAATAPGCSAARR
jgi:phosphatidylglycerophosphate synthase